MSTKGAIYQALCDRVTGLECYIVEQDCSGGPCTYSVSTSKKIPPKKVDCNESRVRFQISSQTCKLLMEPSNWEWTLVLFFDCMIDIAEIMERFKEPISVQSSFGNLATRLPNQVAPMVGLLEEMRPLHGLDPSKGSKITLIFSFSEDF